MVVKVVGSSGQMVVVMENGHARRVFLRLICPRFVSHFDIYIARSRSKNAE
jgi:hypothetical protein